MPDESGNKQEAEAKVGERSPHVAGYTESGNLYTVGDDILALASHKKYEKTHVLEGQQLQYRSGNHIKTVNFKQDYVVLIRKKLYYAANAVNNATWRGNVERDMYVGKGHYLRTYRVDNFISLNTNITVMGTPGNCSITIKGGERVYCYEHNEAVANGTPGLSSMVYEDQPPGVGSMISDATNTLGRNNVATGNQQKDDEAMMATGQLATGKWNRETATMLGETKVKVEPNPNLKDTAHFTYYDDQGNVKFEADVHHVYPNDSKAFANENTSDWKFAEKCDWEEMDEVWVFGKSNFERTESGAFKMNQIFFGYIDTINKSYSAGKSNGLVIVIQASDQLKLLGLSYVTLNPTMTPGASMNGQGFDIRFGRRDARMFGTFVLFDPYEAMRVAGGKSAADVTDEQAKTAEENTNSAYACFAYDNVFAGLAVNTIIKQLCDDAGIPEWYTATRIEPIQFPPYVMKLKQASPGSLFQASTRKRLDVCTEAAKRLLLEFFADEMGNIVLKCPSYALGVNSLVANNMGYTELQGGVLNQVNTTQVTNGYWAPKPKVDASAYEATGTDANLPDVNESNRASVEELYKQREQALREWEAAVIADNAISQGIKPSEFNKMMDGYMELQETGIQKLVYERMYSNINGDGVAVQKMVSYEPGMTITDLAQNAANWNGDTRGEDYVTKCLLSDPHNKQMLSDAGAIGADGTVDLSKLKSGMPLNITYNAGKSQEELEEAFLKIDNAYMDAAANDGHKTQSEYDAELSTYYDNTVSELTDALIPEIPQEFIINFTLTQTDKGLFNSYEVNVEGDLGIYDKGGPITKCSRVFADITSWVRFGVRPCAQVFNFPYMGNRENAHLLGYMLCAASMARRNAGSLTMIEDSFIRVGNPVRFLAYDEHPGKPLYDQTKAGDASGTTALETMSRGGIDLSAATKLANSSSLENIIKGIPKVGGDTGGSGDGSVVAGGIRMNIDDLTTGGCFPNINVSEAAGERTVRTNHVTPNGGTVTSEGTVPVSDPNVKAGNYLNYDTSQPGGKNVAFGSSYVGTKASDLAKVTDAQTVYYVEAIQRGINPSDKSTMTLTLSCGRMLGHPSVVDYMLLLYKTYYDPNTGFCPHLMDISEITSAYEGSTKDYEIQPGDTLSTIALNEYEIDLYPPQSMPDGGYKEKYGGYAVEALSSGGEPHGTAAGLGYKVYTGAATGGLTKIAGGAAEAYAECTYHIYDFDDTHWVAVWTGGYATTNVPSDGNSAKAHVTAIANQKKATEKAEFIASLDISWFTIETEGRGVKDVTQAQRQLDEMVTAIIALNPDEFGSSLEITGEQFNKILDQYVGKPIKIPTDLKVGRKKPEGKSFIRSTGGGSATAGGTGANSSSEIAKSFQRRSVTEAVGGEMLGQRADGTYFNVSSSAKASDVAKSYQFATTSLTNLVRR